MCRVEHAGFTFLELLIALALFSAGLLGLLQLQFLAQRQLQEALYVTSAAQQAYNLSSLWTMFNCGPGSSLAYRLEHTWNEDNARLLPQGEGRFESDGIHVFWHTPLSKSQLQLYQKAGR